MKKLLIIIFVFIAIGSKAQTSISEGTISIFRNVSIRNYEPIKDTTILDTVACDFLAIDHLDAIYNSTRRTSIMYFYRGYKITERKGVFSQSSEECECPDHMVGCLVYHQRLVDHLPPVKSVHYTDRHYINIYNDLIIKELK